MFLSNALLATFFRSPYLPNHFIMGLALSRDAVVVHGGEELQQPLFGHFIGVLVGEGFEPALGAPVADGG